MAKKRTPPGPQPAPAPPPARPAVTAERFRRLYQLVRLLGEGARTREQVLGPLGLDVRGFYRDLELLRAVSVPVLLEQGRYVLGVSADDAVARLPYPDPHLNLGEARQLARGRTAGHRRLQQEIDSLVAAPGL